MKNVFDNRWFRSLKAAFKRFVKKTSVMMNDESGNGVVEVILIIVVVVGLVFVFKSQLEGIVSQAFSSLSGDVSSIVG